MHDTDTNNYAMHICICMPKKKKKKKTFHTKIQAPTMHAINHNKNKTKNQINIIDSPQKERMKRSI